MQPQNNNTYNQPSMEQMIPPQMGAVRPRGWRERWMHRFGMDTAAAPLAKGELTVPNWITGKSIVFFFIAMFACWGAFGYVPDFNLWIVSAISIVIFFYVASSMSKSLSHSGEKHFLRNVFLIGVIVRLLWILYMYYFFNPEYYGNTYGDGADVDWYMPFGKDIAKWIENGFDGSFSEIQKKWDAAFDDIGYPAWLGVIYLIVGVDNDIFVPFLLKCILGAYCAISIYRVAKRHFGEGTARMAALFVALNPNMIYWCGTMMKETEMVFLCCLAVDLVDRTFSSGSKQTFKSLLPGILAGMALFFFRAPLAIVLFLAMGAHIAMASSRVMSAGKKIIAGVMVGVVLLVGMGDRIQTQSERIISSVQSDEQAQNMKWRENRTDAKGNQNKLISKYAGAAVFAPLIFTIPFPTFNVAMENQLLQQQLSGGNYIKNIFSFFVIIVMLMMLISGEWRRHVFILAYTLGYLAALVFSNFAHSSRFHMPIWPFLMLFAAYGIQLAKSNPRYRRWFTIALVVEVVACLGWNYFKLKGRGMI